jgi:hypothetical protein
VKVVLFETRYVHAALKYDGFELRTGFPRRHADASQIIGPCGYETISGPPSTTQIANVASK